MFAIIGDWPVEEALDAQQLAHIVETVKQHPGFVRGYWGQAPDDAGRAHAIVVLDDEVAARSMAAGVTAAIPSASIRIIRVLADA
ncbi:hypothetical protein [Jiangella muralis]|uniref:hypothetical protein n=1 Tax=Jiangella muralis TaxID=702383 RepID=UPI0012FC119D|nr:hypothetical protein [Jiangella muralis]